MAVLLNYQHQLKFYDTILEKMAVEDTGPLAILTADGRVSLSGKVMQIFSPLIRDIMTHMSACGSGQEPVFVSLPESKSATVNQLMDLLLRGQVMEVGAENIEEVKRNVITLAESLGLKVKLDKTRLDDSRDQGMNDISCRGRLRVRNLEELVIPSRANQRPNGEDCSHGGPMDNVTNSGRDLPIEDDDGEQAKENDGFGELEDAASGEVPVTLGSKQSSITIEGDEEDFDHEDRVSGSQTMIVDDVYGGWSDEEDDIYEENNDYSLSYEGGDYESQEEDDNDDLGEETSAEEDQEIRDGDGGESQEQISFGSGMKEVRVMMMRMKPSSFTPVSSVPVNHAFTDNHEDNDDILSHKHTCGQCGNRYNQKRGLKQHIKSVHDKVKYPCLQCGKKFKSKTGLREHGRTVHEGVQFTCTECGKVFQSRDGLREHRQTVHEGVQFPCGKCEKIFKSRRGLQLHTQTVHNGVRFPCGKCEKTLKSRDGLRKHRQIVHKGVQFPL